MNTEPRCTCGDVEAEELKLLRQLEQSARSAAYTALGWTLDKLDELRCNPSVLDDPRCPKHSAWQESGP